VEEFGYDGGTDLGRCHERGQYLGTRCLLPGRGRGPDQDVQPSVYVFWPVDQRLASWTLPQQIHTSPSLTSV
jgi:hypothetical protein